MANPDFLGGTTPEGDHVHTGTQVKALGDSTAYPATESGVKAVVTQAANDQMNQAGFNLSGLFGSIINSIGMALQGILQGGIFNSVDQASLNIRDGQEDLANDLTLLSPLVDFGSAAMPAGQPFVGTGTLPFTRQIGIARNVEVRGGSGGGLTLKDKGLWNLSLHAVGSWVFAGGTYKVQVALTVYRPDGVLYSRQISMHTIEETSNGGEQTHSISSSVVVPAADYFVLAEVLHNASARRFLGGPQWSRLTAQHISRETTGNWGTGSEASDAEES